MNAFIKPQDEDPLLLQESAAKSFKNGKKTAHKNQKAAKATESKQ